MLRPPRAARSSILAGVAVLATVGAAAGYWTGSGSGSGQARLADEQVVVLSGGTPTAQLYPGHTTDVAVTASNPNPFPVRVASLVIDTELGTRGFEVDPGHSDCELSSLTFTTQDNAGAGWTVPARIGSSDGTLALTLAASLAMSLDAPDSCQGALFTVHLEAGP